MSKAGLVLINYSHAILDQAIQNNGGCPEAAGPDKDFCSPENIRNILIDPGWGIDFEPS